MSWISRYIDDMSPNPWQMRLSQVGIWSMELRSEPGLQVIDAAAELDSLGFQSLWIPGLDGGPAFADAERLLTAAPRATVALGVLSIWKQPAFRVAEQAAMLNAQFPRRLLTGLGVSNPESAASVGQDFGRPLESMGRYLDELDAAINPLAGSERILAALGPKMAALAGSRSAGLHPFLVPAAASARYREIVGTAVLIAPHLAVVLETDRDHARSIARAGIGTFINFPSYRANLRRLGFTDNDVVPGGSDRLIDALIAWGDLDSVAARIREHLDAGADHVALHVLTDSPGLPLTQWRQLADLLPTANHLPQEGERP
jgi:probable F420-dependent oxidoreductase